jgi:hypothetical protein
MTKVLWVVLWLGLMACSTPNHFKPPALLSSAADALKTMQPDPYAFERYAYRCYEPDYFYNDSSYEPHEQVKRVCDLVRVAP